VFDNASRLTDRIENGVSMTFGFDATHQVTSDDSTGYSYDGTGNRTNAGYSTGAAKRLMSDGTWTWTYDAAGNATARTNGTATWTYSYDGRGQMIGAQESSTGKRVTFIYDAYVNKVERQADDGSTSSIQRYVYDGWDTNKSGAIGTENFDQAFELNGSNALVMRRLFGAGFDALLARQTAVGTVSWYVTDQQGSVRTPLERAQCAVPQPGTVARDREHMAGLVVRHRERASLLAHGLNRH
jgi:YD repeat-containing protein